MSDWNYLNAHRVPPEKDEAYGSTPADGFNGAFILQLNALPVLCIASDGFGWQHVSVSTRTLKIPPSWSIMCQVKDLFWEPEDVVMQLHPAKSQYVNFHQGCLHLWRPTAPGVTIPTPPSIMVGPKNEDQKMPTQGLQK